MQRAVCLSAVGVALAGQPHRDHHFLALSQVSCSPDAYTGPSCDEYKQLCADIDANCKALQDELNEKHAANIAEKKRECARQKRILDGKEDTHAAEKSDRKEEDVDVADAKEVVADLAHCRPEYYAAKEELDQEEATPNDTPKAIDDECEAKKKVMKLEACLKKLEAAEDVLATQKDEHAEESSEENKAAAALPPQEEKVRIACAIEDNGPPKANCGGQGKKDALLAQADKWVEDLLEEYLRQKKILEGKEDVHADEKADVAPERKDVTKARADVKEYAHCPPELEAAKAEYSKQQGIPNDTPQNVDDECEAQKAVLKAQACVDKLRAAEKVLAVEKEQHDKEAGEEADAAAALPPQEKIVCELKAALDAAKAARKCLPCGSDSSPAPEPKKEEAKSGAARATAFVAVVAAAFCALVQA